MMTCGKHVETVWFSCSLLIDRKGNTVVNGPRSIALLLSVEWIQAVTQSRDFFAIF